MATENESTHYNYQSLDKLLTKDFDPQQLGDQMDEIMNDLVCYAKYDDDYSGDQLEWRYYILRTLRDLFWKLPKA